MDGCPRKKKVILTRRNREMTYKPATINFSGKGSTGSLDPCSPEVLMFQMSSHFLSGVCLSLSHHTCNMVRRKKVFKLIEGGESEFQGLANCSFIISCSSPVHELDFACFARMAGGVFQRAGHFADFDPTWWGTISPSDPSPLFPPLPLFLNSAVWIRRR